MPTYVSTDRAWKKTDSANYEWDGRGWYRVEPISQSPQQAPSSMPGLLPTAIRAAGPIIGSIAGGALGSFVALGPGTAYGALAGGAAGSGLSEWAAEALEVDRGERAGVNLPQIATQTALGGLPLGRVKAGASLARTLAQRAGMGALMGGTSTAATGLAETGTLPSYGQIERGVLLGGALGGALGGVESRLSRSRAPMIEPVPPPPPPIVPRTPSTIILTDAPSATTTTPSIIRGDTPVALPGTPILDATGRPMREVGMPPLPGARAMGQPVTDSMKGLQPFLNKFSPALREGIAGRIERVDDRVEMTTEQLGGLADHVRVNLTNVLPKGTAVSAEEIIALARTMRQKQMDIATLAKEVSGVDASDLSRMKLLQAQADADIITQSILGARAEAGRALGAFNFYNRIIESGDINAIRQVLSAPGIKNRIEGLAEGFKAVGEDPLAQLQFLQKQSKTTFGDKARSYYYANILSGVGTHERNVLGNIGSLTSDLIVQPVAGMIARAKGDRSIRLDELPSQAVGAVAGLEQGFREALFTLRHGINPRALSKAAASAEGGVLDVPRVEFSGVMAPFNAPGRAMDATDTFFKAVTRNKTLYGMAHTMAKNEKLTGEAFQARVLALRNGTAIDAEPLHRAADNAAARSTFQEALGPVGQDIQAALRAHPALTLVVPFFKTPTNILKQGLEFSPAGFLMKAAKQEGRLGIEAQARATAGSVGAGFLFYLASTGRLSGAGPAPGPERESLLATGWKPNSIRVGDAWRSYQPIQPLNVVASLVANGVETWKDAGANKAEVPDMIGQVLARGANTFLDQSFVSGLSDAIEAVRDPERSAMRVGGRILSGFMPFSSLQRTVARTMDPVQRNPQTMREVVQAGIPGVSTGVPARLDRFGQTIQTSNPFDPLMSSPTRRDPVSEEMRRIGYDIGRPTDRLTLKGQRLPLSAEDQQALEAERGQRSYAALAKLIENSSYQQMSPDRRRVIAEKVVTDARSAVSEKYRRKYSSSVSSSYAR